ncbi:hypothetical protein TL16_g09648 [Triparma laevis f. inornata]|uniref:Serine hydrolase FSH domain-containing protein n=1 Tax=Triparma laevis f. inornata TaxID=1714386 RepID=A0A9W7EMU9_9STRA|nr:hypothetical protein TL16_g09648 [Triparma laevis f. inornata]
MASFFTTPRESGSTPPSSTNLPNTPRIKILCLHGGSHNAPLFKKQLTPLINYLRKRVNSEKMEERVPPCEFVFVNGPLLNDGSLSYSCLPRPCEEDLDADKKEHNRQLREQRMWFHEPSSEHSLDPSKLAGVDATLLWLSQCWNSQLQSDPYHGILSFSQGASFAGMWPLISTEQYKCRNLRFEILINSYIPCPPPEKGFGNVTRQEHYEDNILNIPSLHVYGVNNDIVRAEESREVVKRFVDPVVYEHEFGHALPGTQECFNVVAEFLRREGRRLLEDYDERILSMQSQLKSLEFQAGSLIAHESELASYFKTYSDSDKNRITRFIQNDVLSRTPKMCNVIEKGNQKVVYRRYASLYFVAGVQPDQNELVV